MSIETGLWYGNLVFESSFGLGIFLFLLLGEVWGMRAEVVGIGSCFIGLQLKTISVADSKLMQCTGQPVCGAVCSELSGVCLS